MQHLLQLFVQLPGATDLLAESEKFYAVASFVAGSGHNKIIMCSIAGVEPKSTYLVYCLWSVYITTPNN